MARTKGALGKKTLAKMGLLTNGLDKYKITRKNSGEKPQNDRKNSGIDKPKRIRRTKAQLIADGYYDKDKPKVKATEVKVNEPKEKNKDTNRSHLFVSGSLSVDKLSDQQINRAKERGDENWEQDFRNDYESGQKIYYVEINELCHTKEVLELYVGTVYSKVIVAWVDRGESHSIGIEDADKIFRDEKEAKKYYQKVRI